MKAKDPDIYYVPGDENDNASPEKQERVTAQSKLDRVWNAMPHSFLWGVLRVVIAVGLTFASYFLVNNHLPEEMTPWFKELVSLVLALFILWGISHALGGSSRVGGAVFLFLLVLFIWRLVVINEEAKLNAHETAKAPVVQAIILHPKSDPYIFHLDSVGQSTNWMTFPLGNKYSYSIASHDYGYKIVFNNGDVFLGDPNGVIPERRHSTLKLVATKPNQFIKLQVRYK